MQSSQTVAHHSDTSTLVDVLERILDRGIVVAGDIAIQLADIDLLRIRIRLVICSVDRAEAIGLDWWRQDAYFAQKSAASSVADSPKDSLPGSSRISTLRAENKALKGELARLRQTAAQ